MTTQPDTRPQVRSEDRPSLGAVRYDVEHHDEVYAIVDGHELHARVFVPVGAPPGRPGVIDVHGGCWALFDRKVDRFQCERLAAAGAVVAAVDFRQAPEGRWPDPVADVAAAVRWLKAHADRFELDPDAVLLMGGSSGGQLAMWVALRPDAPETSTVVPELPAGLDPSTLDARVRGVLALWPVAEPDARYRYLLDRQAAGTESSTDPLFNLPMLISGQDAFFGDVATMAAANVVRVLDAGEHEALPPLWLAHPELDENVTPAMSEAAVAAWRAAGGAARLRPCPGVGHGFVNFGGEAADACLEDLIAAATTMLEERP